MPTKSIFKSVAVNDDRSGRKLADALESSASKISKKKNFKKVEYKLVDKRDIFDFFKHNA